MYLYDVELDILLYEFVHIMWLCSKVIFWCSISRWPVYHVTSLISAHVGIKCGNFWFFYIRFFDLSSYKIFLKYSLIKNKRSCCDLWIFPDNSLALVLIFPSFAKRSLGMSLVRWTWFYHRHSFRGHLLPGSWRRCCAALMPVERLRRPTQTEASKDSSHILNDLSSA